MLLRACCGYGYAGGYNRIESNPACDRGRWYVKLEFTAVFEEVSEGFIGYVEELPGANTQGATLDEARTNLAEAVELVLESNRSLVEKGLGTRKIIREPLRISA